jgi:polyphosphate glucokinase
MKALGIDIGGSGIKAALVDTQRGQLLTERYRVPTPSPATPNSLARSVARIVHHFSWKGPIGCGVPGPIKNGKVMVVANLDKSWVGARAHEVFAKACGQKVAVINDADAAGLAESRFGACRKTRGVVVVLTLGTGIGSALLYDGRLIPNSEFGQIEIRGKKGERRAASRVRKEKNLSWEQWAKLLDEYLQALEGILWPDLFVIGGGVSRKSKRFISLLHLRARIVPAKLHNEAGIVGAALNACLKYRH